MQILYLIIAILLFIIFSFLIFFVTQKQKKSRLGQSLGMSLFSIKMPKYDQRDDQQDIKALTEKMEQIFSSFLYLKNPNIIKRIMGYGLARVSLEIASEVGGSDITFYIAVPTYMKSGIEKTIQGVYPDAVVEKVPKDYNVFEPKGRTVGARLFLKESLYLPIRTYKELEGDPLSSITNALSKIEPEEGSAIQIILRPAVLNIKKKTEKILTDILEKGDNPKKALLSAKKGAFSEIVSTVFEAFSSSQKKIDEGKEKELEAHRQDLKGSEITIEGIKNKAQKPIMEVNIRLIGVGKDQIRAQEILDHLIDSFSQFSSSLNSFNAKKAKKRRLKKLINDFIFRDFNQAERLVLNLEEITSLFHLPLSHIVSPKIKRSKTKEVAPPSELPKTGLNLIGKAIFRGEETDVLFSSLEDRRRHFYVVGQTGTGKSSLLKEMIRQDMENGEGVGVIDPNGDLIEDILANIPKHRVEDVILFEPFDMQRPYGLNMLEWQRPEQKDFAISEMITIFSKLFPPEVIGPMFEHYMRNAMLALMADKDNPGTLVEIPRIFTDDDFMKEKMQKVKDPMVRSFWLKEWAKTTGQTRSDMLGYVVSKVGRFVENEMMRNIIGQSKSSFDLVDIMDNKKIFLANLSKGQTGEMNSSLLGLILVSKMQIAAFGRSAIPQEQRKDFYLYIDEFQNFTTDSIATILSEARKYRLNLILAHQFMPQLTEEIRNAVIGNVGSMASFRVGADDAEFLEKQFEPEFSKFDLLNIDNFQFICKMMINNNLSSPFKVKTIKPQEGNKASVDSIKKLAKLKYGRSRDIVEREINDRMKLDT